MHLKFLNNVISIKTKAFLRPGIGDLSCCQKLLNYLTSYLLTFNIPDEGYSRNALCTLNLILYDFIASLLKTECYNYSSFVNVQSVKR